MSRFSRAYDAALQQSNLTRGQAAATAGLDASVVSRILNDDRPATPEHVSALVRALSNVSDREHCVIQFLIDQCPEDLRERLHVTFGSHRELRPPPEDSLARHLAALELAATDNPDLRKLFANLAALMSAPD